MYRSLKLFSLIALLLIVSNRLSGQKNDNYVILVSMDAFRWDYPEKITSPNFDYIENNGVRAESLKPCFPSITFPNHYSIATGLYPDHHGIVGNSFYDPDQKLKYSISNRAAVENSVFYLGEPIWVTAEKQSMKSASFYWVGSEAPIKNIQPTYWKKYEHTFPFEQRIDTVLSWLSKPIEQRPRLITLYFHEPDEVGHDFGPNSPETMKKLQHLDSILGKLIQGVQQLPIANKINLIVLADHGMGEISNNRLIKLSDHLPKHWCKYHLGSNPFMTIQPTEGYTDSILTNLNKIPNIKAWKKSEVPARFHYGTSNRIYDIVVTADSSYSITWDKNLDEYSVGTHGYDNSNRDMYAIFYAMGPVFKQKYKHPQFDNIDVYSLICHILGLTPAPNDGNFENVRNMLR